MKLFFSLLTLISLTFFLGLMCKLAPAQQNNETEEREAIKLFIKNYEDAWNRHDAKALAQLYHTDAAWVNWFGAYSKGRDSIQAHYQTIHSSYYKTSHFRTLSIEDLIFIKPDVAITHNLDELTGDERYPGQIFRHRRTLVLTKRDGVWRILAGQNAKLREDVK